MEIKDDMTTKYLRVLNIFSAFNFQMRNLKENNFQRSYIFWEGNNRRNIRSNEEFIVLKQFAHEPRFCLLLCQSSLVSTKKFMTSS